MASRNIADRRGGARAQHPGNDQEDQGGVESVPLLPRGALLSVGDWQSDIHTVAVLVLIVWFHRRRKLHGVL